MKITDKQADILQKLINNKLLFIHMTHNFGNNENPEGYDDLIELRELIIKFKKKKGGKK